MLCGSKVRWGCANCRWSAGHEPRQSCPGSIAGLCDSHHLDRPALGVGRGAVRGFCVPGCLGRRPTAAPLSHSREPVAGAALGRAGLGPAAARHPAHGLSLGDVECRVELGHLAGAVLPGAATVRTIRGAALVSALRAVLRSRAGGALDGPDVHLGRQDFLAFSERLHGSGDGAIRLPEPVCRVSGDDPADRAVAGVARPPAGIRQLRDSRGHAGFGDCGRRARRLRSPVGRGGRGAAGGLAARHGAGRNGGPRLGRVRRHGRAIHRHCQLADAPAALRAAGSAGATARVPGLLAGHAARPPRHGVRTGELGARLSAICAIRRR